MSLVESAGKRPHLAIVILCFLLQGRLTMSDSLLCPHYRPFKVQLGHSQNNFLMQYCFQTSRGLDPLFCPRSHIFSLGCSPVPLGAFLVAQTVKNPPAMWDTQVQPLSWEDPLAESVATHSSMLAWRIPMDRGDWWATVRGITKSRIRLGNYAQGQSLCPCYLLLMPPNIWVDQIS